MTRLRFDVITLRDQLRERPLLPCRGVLRKKAIRFLAAGLNVVNGGGRLWMGRRHLLSHGVAFWLLKEGSEPPGPSDPGPFPSGRLIRPVRESRRNRPRHLLLDKAKERGGMWARRAPRSLFSRPRLQPVGFCGTLRS